MPVDERADKQTRRLSHQDLQELWQRAQAGDEAAYRQALTLLAGRLRGFFVRRMQAVADDVEDLVQETLLAMHLQRGTYRPDVPVMAWAHAIARHKLVDLWRRRGRREAVHLSLDELDEADQPVVAADASARHDLRVLLALLPPAQRQAIALTRLEGLSMAEASQRSGVSVAALKVQVHRGLQRLMALMRGREPGS